jgi:signal peptidase I
VWLLYFLLVSYALLSLSLFLLFPKAGVDAKKGLIPGANFIEWGKLIGRSPLYILWLLFPIVNIFIFVGMAVDLSRSFGRSSFLDAALSVIYAPVMFFWLSKDNNVKYEGPVLVKEREFMKSLADAKASGDKYKFNKLSEENPFKRSAPREWTESIIFAVFAATFIRLFLLEAFVIPTGSMEGTLKVGDFLFVSKAHYGMRMPMTVAMFPLVHNQLPVVGGESYLSKPNLPYKRLKAFETVEAGKNFVFNWPAGDSVYITSTRSVALSQVKNEPYWMTDREIADKVKKNDFVVRPIDKRDHYIKRCVAGPGDTLQIIDRQIYINGKPQKNPTHLQFKFLVQLPPNFNRKKMEDWNIDPDFYDPSRNEMRVSLNSEQIRKLKSLGPETKIMFYPFEAEPGKLFPNDKRNFKDWSVDNFGPIWMPKAGATVNISPDNIALYTRIITAYEHNTLTLENDKIYINGKESSSYTFSQDYYWAMGDNRHDSEDSRTWGFVPHDHVVGKPLLIWFSTKKASIRNGINWNRIMSNPNKKEWLSGNVDEEFSF